MSQEKGEKRGRRTDLSCDDCVEVFGVAVEIKVFRDLLLGADVVKGGDAEERLVLAEVHRDLVGLELEVEGSGCDHIA